MACHHESVLVRKKKPLYKHTSQAPSYDSLKQAADKLAADARNLAMDEEYMSPFAMKAQHYGLNFRGGKLDDITVLLASVVDCWDGKDDT